MFLNKLKFLNKLLNTNRVKAFRYINDEKIQNIINYFIPTKIENINLQRIGDENDGGYLVPNILSNIKYCFSAGVGHTNKFETELNDLNIKCYER